MSYFYFLGYRKFKTEDEIKQIVLDTFYTDDENKRIVRTEKRSDAAPIISMNDLHCLKIFQTTKQQTWIVASRKYLICLLDDIDEETKDDDEIIRWKMELKQDTISPIENFIKTKPAKSPKYGLIDFGTGHRNWYYSKDIFETEEEAKESVTKLIKSSISK